MTDRFEDWKEPYFDDDGYAYRNSWAYAFHRIGYGWRCQNYEGLKLGKYTDIGFGTYINAKYGVEIGENTQIGGGTFIYSEDTIDGTNGKIVIKENCKIGSNSVLLPNVIIGNNSVVGAFSLIKYGQIIPDNEIWFGIPAKKVGFIINEERNYY